MTVHIELGHCEAVQTRVIRQEWCRPGFHESGPDGEPYPNHVAIKTSVGWLLLTDVVLTLSGPEAGRIRRVPVRPEELEAVD